MHHNVDAVLNGLLFFSFTGVVHYNLVEIPVSDMANDTRKQTQVFYVLLGQLCLPD